MNNINNYFEQKWHALKHLHFNTTYCCHACWSSCLLVVVPSLIFNHTYEISSMTLLAAVVLLPPFLSSCSEALRGEIANILVLLGSPRSVRPNINADGPNVTDAPRTRQALSLPILCLQPGPRSQLRRLSQGV